MRTVFTFLLGVLASPFLWGQSGLAEIYDATAGFDGKRVENTTFGYKVFAEKTAPAPNTFTRMTFETGVDGTFWGVTATTDYPRPAGTLTDVGPDGDYVTAETFETSTGMALRIRRWFPNLPGYFNNLAEINFPDLAQLSLERLVFREDFPGGVFLAGQYRTLAEPQRPVPFLVRSSSSSFEWWIHTLADIPPTSFAFVRLSTFADGGCAVVFKKTDEQVFIERYNAAGDALWRRGVGFLDEVSALTEGPGGVVFYTVVNPPFSGPAPTYGIAAAVAPDGTVVFEKDLNTLLGQFSVVPRYILPLPDGGSVLTGFESPFLGAGYAFFAARLDAEGQLIWKKNYAFFQNGATFAFGKTTSDHGFIFTGSSSGKVFLFKIDQHGAGAANVQYCPAVADQPWHEWIGGVGLGDIQQASGKSQYSDFLAISTSLGIGQPAEIELTAGYSYTTYDEYFGVWIDYNHDNVFGGDEMAVAAILARPPDGTPSKMLVSSFTVPQTAQPGPTRMRVSMQRGAFAGPCDNPTFGEVEDYTVDLKITGPAPDLTTPAWETIPANASCFTNPGQAFGFLAGLVLNTGPLGAGPFSAKAWLSPDDQFGNADDLLWQTISYDTLAPAGLPGNPLGLNISTPVPPATPPGFYHIFVAVDADHAVAELEEGNNLFHTTTQIGAPDYFLQNLAGVPSVAPTGSILNFSFELHHSGLFPVSGLLGGAEVSIFLSPDNVPDNGNEILLGTETIGFDAFNPAGTVVKTVSLPLPGVVTAGAYFLVLRVAPANYCDQNLQNNTLVGPEIQVIGLPAGAYCAAAGDFPWHDWIAGVSVADLSHASGKSPYSDFSTFTASLAIGTSVPVALSAGFSWTGYDEYWKIWIDYDHDGTFAAPGETAFQGFLPKAADGTPAATLQGSIAVPATALPGLTRMRVAMKRGAVPGPCESFAFGEVEDYSVNIASAFGDGDARFATVPTVTGLRFDLFPNPAGDVVFLQIEGGAALVQVKIFDQNGRLKQATVLEKTGENPLVIPLSGFQNGVYWLQIMGENGQIAGKKLVVLH